MSKFVATVSGCRQIGESAFKQEFYSRVFSGECSMIQVISWAKSQLGRDSSLNDITFSEYTGESE